MDIEGIKEEARNLFASMGFGDSIEAIEGNQGVTCRIEVRMQGDARMLIGEYGNNLSALEHVLRRIVSKKHGEEVHFSLDINDYRMHRLEDLKQDVKAAAHAVRMYK